MAPSVSLDTLMASRSAWEIAGYVSLFFVAVGVAGEFTHDFAPTLRKKWQWWDAWGGKIFGLVLIAALAAELITEVQTNNANAQVVAILEKEAADIRLKAATTEKVAAGLRIDLGNERKQTAARSWTKEQYDTLQSLRGVVTDVGVVSEPYCIECKLFASHLELALHMAGIRLYEDNNPDQHFCWGTGIIVYLPIRADLNNAPLIIALKRANLNALSLHHLPEEMSIIRTDIPVICVGEKWPQHLVMPYSPNNPTGWKTLPLRKTERRE
jgi:hypothetical protein